MSGELCPLCQKPVWAVRHGSFSVSVTCECGYDGPLYPVAKTPDPLRAVAEKMAEALREASATLSNIPAPLSYPLWTRMCKAIRTGHDALAEWDALNGKGEG